MGFWHNQPVRRRSGTPQDWRVPIMRYNMTGLKVGHAEISEIQDFLNKHFSAYRWSYRALSRMDKLISIRSHNIIGCIGGRLLSDGIYYVDLLCVDKNWRGNGVAGILNGHIAESIMDSNRTCRIIFKIDKSPLDTDIIPLGKWNYWVGTVNMLCADSIISIPYSYNISVKEDNWISIGTWKICGIGNEISKFWGLVSGRIFDIEGIYGEGNIADIIRWLKQEGYTWVSITDMKPHKPVIDLLGLTQGNSFWLYSYGWDGYDSIIATV